MTTFEEDTEDLADDAKEEGGISTSLVENASRKPRQRWKRSKDPEKRWVQRGSTTWEMRHSITIDFVYLRREVSSVRDRVVQIPSRGLHETADDGYEVGYEA